MTSDSISPDAFRSASASPGARNWRRQADDRAQDGRFQRPLLLGLLLADLAEHGSRQFQRRARLVVFFAAGRLEQLLGRRPGGRVRPIRAATRTRPPR